jgi:hypothetical protein
MSIDIRKHFEQNEGVLRLIPNFVPRRFSYPGKRLRLHPDDYYALGTKRGAIKERWFSSVIPAMNGPLAPPDEGMSYVSYSDDVNDRYVFKDAVDELKAALIGSELHETYGTWPMYSKFFDYRAPLFHHLHLRFDDAKRVGMLGKPEAYYFPFQLNNVMGDFPVTYFGYDPDVSKEEVKERLLSYESGDNKITELSRAYRIELGTGWYTPPGVVHAPGSVLTYEPQWNSDVNSVHENITAEEVYSYDFLVENCPDDKKKDIEYVLDLLDWEKNIDPHYRKNFFRPPIDCSPAQDGVSEKWITYGNDYIGAKELTIAPGASCVHTDEVAFGCILIQGNGTFGKYKAHAASMLRYGQLSSDEYFVSEKAAKTGIRIENQNQFEPMVILKHFGPNHKKMPR